MSQEMIDYWATFMYERVGKNTRKGRIEMKSLTIALITFVLISIITMVILKFTSQQD